MKDEVTNVLRLANLVRQNVQEKRLLTPYDTLLVTLSGGQDSMCSLLLLYLLQTQITSCSKSDANLGSSEPPLTRALTQAPSKLELEFVVTEVGPVVLKGCKNGVFCEKPEDLVPGTFEKNQFSTETILGMKDLFDKCLIEHFALLWCNHFWQRDSFFTMPHVAKINLCFPSTMCFFLPLKGVLCEQDARQWRHKSIQRACVFFHYDSCTQGHTKSDRVETILFNILRGTGMAGIRALQWKKSFYSFSCQRFYPRLSYYKLNRPLLKLTQANSGRISYPHGFKSRRADSTATLCKLRLHQILIDPPHKVVNQEKVSKNFRLKETLSFGFSRQLRKGTFPEYSTNITYYNQLKLII